MLLRGVVVLALALGTVGCKSKESGAKEYFATAHSCPEDRVTVKPRPDMDMASAVTGAPVVATPPPEVASDPGRLAKWQADQASKPKDSRDVFEVEGCGHHEFVFCGHPKSLRHGRRSDNLAQVQCTSMAAGSDIASTLANVNAKLEAKEAKQAAKQIAKDAKKADKQAAKDAKKAAKEAARGK